MFRFTCILSASLSGLICFPHGIAYFNVIAGGAVNGYKCLAGSNLDWGQDLFGLQEWRKAHPLETPFYVAYHGAFDSRLVVASDRLPESCKHFSQLTPDMLAEAAKVDRYWIAISETFLQGMPGTILYADGSIFVLTQGEMSAFSQLNVVGRAGYSIKIFHVDRRDVTPTASAHSGRFRLAR